jgi:plastocyanin
MSDELHHLPGVDSVDAGGPVPTPHPPIPPFLYPVLALAFGGILVFSFSRILLFISKLTLHLGGHQIEGKTITAVIALLMALNILVGAALVAYGKRVRQRPASYPLLVGAGVVVVAAGFVALGLKAPGEKPKGPPAQAVPLVAQGLKFQQTALQFTAGGRVTVRFDNKDVGTSHNFVLFNGKDANAPVIFRGQIVTGPTTANYSFKAPGPGSYYFHCDVHPTTMFGTATVGAGPPGGGGPGAGGLGGPVTLDAKNISFVQKTLTAASGGPITVHFDNMDAGTPHNFVVFNGTAATAPVIFRGDIVTGPGTKDYTFTAPPPGTYFFHCDVHPQMTGSLTVE